MSKFIEVTTCVGSSRGVVTWPATGAPAQAYAADEVYPPQTYAEAPASVDDLPGRGNMRVSLSLSLVEPRESAWLTLNGIRYAMEHQWAGWFTLDLPEVAPNPFHVGRNEVVLELVVGGSPHAFPLVLEAVQKDGVIGHDPNSNIIGSITPADLVVNIPPTGAVTIGSVASLSASFRVTNWTGAYLWWSQYKEATLPPFWTKFVRTFEDTSVVGGEVVPVPDPSSKTFDFVVRTQQGVFPFMGSTQLYRGYVMHNIGSVAPERITLGGVSGALTAVVYATESGVLRIVIQGVFGATSARLELGGEVYEVATDQYNTVGVVVDVALPASPLVLGARQAGRLRLAGDLQATPVPYEPEPDPDPDPEEYYADFVMIAGEVAEPWGTVTGYNPAEGIGDMAPTNPLFGEVEGHLISLDCWDDGFLTVQINGVYGAVRASLVIDGGQPYDLDLTLPEVEGLMAFAGLDGSPFVSGQTHSIRVSLVGDISDTAPDPGDQYIDFVMTAGLRFNGDAGFDGYDESDITGDISPRNFVIDGVEGSVVNIMSRWRWGEGEIMIGLDGVYGATGMVLDVEGVGRYPLYVDGPDSPASGYRALPQEVFVAGQVYNLRLYLQGDLHDGS